MNAKAATFFKGKRVWVSGHADLLGAAILRRLWRERCEIILADLTQLDLMRQNEVEVWIRRHRPDAIFLTGPVLPSGPAGAAVPTSLLHAHLMTNLNVMAAARAVGTTILLNLTTTCMPSLHQACEPGTAFATGSAAVAANLAVVRLTQSYYREHGCRFQALVSDCAYGPNAGAARDSPDPLSTLVRTVGGEATRGEKRITVDRDASYGLIHVDDLADAAIFVAQNHEGDSPVYCGWCADASLSLVAGTVAEEVEYHGQVSGFAAPEEAAEICPGCVDLRSLGWRPNISLRDRIR